MNSSQQSQCGRTGDQLIFIIHSRSLQKIEHYSFAVYYISYLIPWTKRGWENIFTVTPANQFTPPDITQLDRRFVLSATVWIGCKVHKGAHLPAMWRSVLLITANLELQWWIQGGGVRWLRMNEHACASRGCVKLAFTMLCLQSSNYISHWYTSFWRYRTWSFSVDTRSSAIAEGPRDAQ